MTTGPSDVDIATRLVELVRSAAPGAETEAVVDTTELALTRFANSFIHQNVADKTTSVRLRLHVDGRTAAGGSTIVDDDGLRALVERTLAAARLAPLDPQWPGLAPAEAVQTVPAVDEQTAHAEPDARAARVRDFVAAARGLETAGYCSTLHWATAFANSAGQSASSSTALAAMDAIARSGAGDGVARLASARLSDLDGARLGARAAAKASAQDDAVQLPPGRYEVVFEPTAVFDLLNNLALYGFNGKAVHEGRSFVEVGQPQFDPSVTIVDDPFDGRGMGLAFDVEGTPKARRNFVDAGMSAAVAHDRRSAAQAGAVSTGHALAGAAAWGAFPLNLRLLPGVGPSTGGDPADDVAGPAADAAVAALVAGVERGLLVSDLWYTRVLDPRTLVITGLTRNGVWLIEDGAVTAAVQNFRFTQSYPRALAAGAVLGIGSHSIGLPSSWEALSYHAPALRLASWNFTGNPSG
jgi:predicted Zn-dependent protease